MGPLARALPALSNPAAEVVLAWTLASRSQRDRVFPITTWKCVDGKYKFFRIVS